MEVDMEKVVALAESAERRAKECHAKRETLLNSGNDGLTIYSQAAGLLNDFFYWSGKATSYRGIVAMAEMATIVEDELDAEGSCP